MCLRHSQPDWESTQSKLDTGPDPERRYDSETV